jgi:hypothetical protein
VRRLALLLVLLAPLAAAPPAPGLELERVNATFDQPVHVAGPPGDPSRLLVVERPGRIQLVKDGSKAPNPYLDITERVDSRGSEEGLLSIAFPSTDAFYAFYTAKTGTTGSHLVVERFTVNPGGDSADPAGVEIIRIPHDDGENHNGGQLQIGPDGHLWISTGDGGGIPRDSDGDSQDPNNLLGKILRIAPRPGAGAAPHYDIPAGNPFGNEVWATGLRNPWRFSFDRATGDLLIGDVGLATMEEIDHAPGPGRGAGANFGWPYYEGTFVLGEGPEPANPHPPLITHTADEGWNAITGGYVIRTPGSPDDGLYVYGDFYVDRLWAYDFATGTKAPTDAAVEMLASFGEDGVGHLYMTSYTGRVQRLIPAPATSGGDGDPDPGRVDGADPSEPGSGDGGTGTRARVDAGTLYAQRVLRRRRVFARVRCEMGCSAKLNARVKVGDEVRLRLRPTRVRLGADGWRRIVVRLGARSRGVVRRALRRGRSVEIVLTLKVENGDGRTVRRRFEVEVYDRVS